MTISEFSAALNQVATERGIPVESVLESIKAALVLAYKRDMKDQEIEVNIEDITVELDQNTGEARLFKGKKDVTPAGFGRIAAQTAKQVILQKIREKEKNIVIDEFKSLIGTIINGHVFRIENNVIILDLGKAHGVLPQSEQVETENYRINQRLKVLIKDVRDSARGTEIIVSRADPEFIRKLFEQEVPEISAGTVVIEAIAREAGSRTKMAVASKDEKIDPVGSCVGQKGVRVQSVIAEVFGEKIDIVPFSSNVEKFIAASLSPAKVTDVELDKDERRAVVSVPEDQQSLAIGKEGQNARLANKLTKWKIDIKGAEGIFSDVTKETDESKEKVVKGIWDEDIKQEKEKQDSKEVATTASNSDTVDESNDSSESTDGLTAEVTD